MCGIAGQTVGEAETAEAAEQQVRLMMEAMKLRGPDGQGLIANQDVVLGMRRLAIIDIEGGNQPITTTDGRYTIVYNGECYDISPLRDELVSRGFRFRTQSDTEVVLAAFAQWQSKALDRLNGMFAFAVWDHHQRSLFLARDRLGIKPLYYSVAAGCIRFASTVEAFSARNDFAGTVDPEAIELYLSTKFITAPHSIYREIRKLPPGHFLNWSQGELTLKAWWDLPAGPSNDLSLEEAGEQSRSLIADAARIRLVSERPVGLCLSGGIDSGLLADALQNQPVKAFSLGFREAAFDESPLAGRVARSKCLEHQVLVCDPEPVDSFHRVVANLDEPLGDSSALALHVLSSLIKQHVTVVLSGTGGDELYGGYLRYVAALQARWMQYVPGIDWLGSLLERRSGNRTADRLGRFAQATSGPPLACLQSLLAPASAGLGARLRQPEFERSLDGFSAAGIFARHFEAAGERSLLGRLLYTDQKTTLVDDYLVKEDRMTMAHSLEGRVPLLDHRLVEFAARLPDHLKIRHTTTKRTLRAIARQCLPVEVSRGKKRGFEIPVSAWLRDGLAEVVRDLLTPATARIGSYVNLNVVRQVVDEHQQKRRDHARLIWCLMILESWLSTHT